MQNTWGCVKCEQELNLKTEGIDHLGDIHRITKKESREHSNEILSFMKGE
jgi:hypothetical protein